MMLFNSPGASKLEAPFPRVDHTVGSELNVLSVLLLLVNENRDGRIAGALARFKAAPLAVVGGMEARTNNVS